MDGATYIVLLTHDPKIDEPTLAAALKTGAAYIGAIGSRKTHADRFERMAKWGVTAEDLQRVYAPIGLDLGGRTPGRDGPEHHGRGGGGQERPGGGGPLRGQIEIGSQSLGAGRRCSMSEMYTERLLDHYRHPRNRGRLDSPDLAGRGVQCPVRRPRHDRGAGAGRADRRSRFEGRGCALCLGAASILTEMLAGKALDELES